MTKTFFEMTDKFITFLFYVWICKAIIYYEIVPGDVLEITVAPKGFGSENMSQVKMLKPSDGLQGVKDFILWAVENAGPNPCPPIVVGVYKAGSRRASEESLWNHSQML